MHFYSLMLASSAIHCSMFQLFFLPCLSIMNYYIRCILGCLLYSYFHSQSVYVHFVFYAFAYYFCSVISLFLTVSFYCHVVHEYQHTNNFNCILYCLLMLTMALYLCAIIYYLAFIWVFKYRLPYSTVHVMTSTSFDVYRVLHYAL